MELFFGSKEMPAEEKLDQAQLLLKRAGNNIEVNPNNYRIIVG